MEIWLCCERCSQRHRKAPKPLKIGKNDFIRGRMYLFPGEDVLVEVELDLLIGDVDAELLKRVPLKVFKAKDVQNTDV